MDFGICVMAAVDDPGFVARMENLGYSHAWIADSQMMTSECFSTLALVAQQTRTIRIGPGVAVAGLRIAPLLAAAMGSIARLAPGRTFLGIGTGNSAWHLMGQKPPRVAEFGEYLRVVRGLLSGEQVDYTVNGRTAPIRFFHHGYPYVDLEQPIPIYVSAFGPKTQALAGQYGDGLIVSFPRVSNLEDAMVNVRAGAAQAGRSLEGYYPSALATLAVLEPGEAANSERILRECGPSVMASVHFVYERLHRSGGEPPEWVRPIWKEFSALMEKVPPRELHFALHGSHYTYLPPEEARLITPDMVKQVCIVGQPDEVVERIRALEQQGLKHLLFLPPVEHKYRMMEDFANKIMRRL